LNPVFTSNVTDSSVGTPVIDEAGNIYFEQYVPMQMPNLVSLSATGAMRWTKALTFSASDLVLGPNGDLFALEASGYHAGDQGHLHSFDTATGAVKSGELTVEGLYHAVILKSGATFAQTYNETAGYGLSRFDQPTGTTPAWAKLAGGDRTAISPQGDLVEVVVGAGNPAPALDVVDLDPVTGDQKWHYRSMRRSPDPRWQSTAMVRSTSRRGRGADCT
jgi:outer membrane protein assembly factor BamB